MSESKRRLILGLQDALGATVTTALHDPDVVEVMLNPDGNLFIERVGQGRTGLPGRRSLPCGLPGASGKTSSQ